MDGLARGDLVTYVNIPTSPMSKKQLNYMEVELQESSTSIRGMNLYFTGLLYLTLTSSASRWQSLSIIDVLNEFHVGFVLMYCLIVVSIVCRKKLQ